MKVPMKTSMLFERDHPLRVAAIRCAVKEKSCGSQLTGSGTDLTQEGLDMFLDEMRGEPYTHVCRWLEKIFMGYGRWWGPELEVYNF